MKLNAAALATLPVGTHRDHIVLGLMFDAGPKRRAWRLRYRANGKQEQKTLGFWLGNNPPAGAKHMGLAEARAAAREILDRIEVGAPVAEVVVQHPKDGMTIERLIDSYEAMRRAKGGRGVKSLDEALRAVRKGLAPYLSMPARSFTKADLRAARDEVAKSTKIKGRKGGALSMSDRFMAYWSPISKWASQEDHIDHDFTAEVVRIGPKLVKRDRTLDDDEIRRIWKACDAFPSEAGRRYGALVKFLLVTAQRREEGATIKHGDVLDGHWKLVTKGGKKHKLRLPQLAVDLIGQGEAGKLVFAGRHGTGPLSGWSKLKLEIDRLSGVSGWRLHDLRRTASTTMEGKLRIPADHIHAVLNHEKQGLHGVYMTDPLEEQKSEALAAWATHLAAILAKKPAVQA